MLDADTGVWLRGEMARNETRMVERLRRDLRAARVVLIGRHATGIDEVKVRTLDGGVLRFRSQGGRLEYFPNWRNRKLDRAWHDAAAMSDWWALRDAAGAAEQLCAEHQNRIDRRGAEKCAGGGE